MNIDMPSWSVTRAAYQLYPLPLLSNACQAKPAKPTAG
jgi:hypothetical protein